MKVNLNQMVRVRLTDHGREVHRQEYAKNGTLALYQPRPMDDRGYSVFQLWELMQVFGPAIHLGAENSFDLDIEILP